MLSILYILVYSLSPHPIYPLLIICPHFLSVSIEIPPKDSPRTICWFIQSVRTEIGKTQISILPKISCIRSDLSSVYVLCIYHMIPWLVLWYKFMCVYVCVYIYIYHYSPASLFFWSLRAETFVPLFHSQNTWQLAHSRCPHLFRDAASNPSHWFSKGHYNPSKVVLSITTGEPSPRNVSPSPIPTANRAHSPQGSQLLFKAEWKINVTQFLQDEF